MEGDVASTSSRLSEDGDGDGGGEGDGGAGSGSGSSSGSRSGSGSDASVLEPVDGSKDPAHGLHDLRCQLPSAKKYHATGGQAGPCGVGVKDTSTQASVGVPVTPFCMHMHWWLCNNQSEPKHISKASGKGGLHTCVFGSCLSNSAIRRAVAV